MLPQVSCWHEPPPQLLRVWPWGLVGEGGDPVIVLPPLHGLRHCPSFAQLVPFGQNEQPPPGPLQFDEFGLHGNVSTQTPSFTEVVWSVPT
jgi:hypothetical protein